MLIINLLLSLVCGEYHTKLYHQILWMCLCSLKMKNMSAKFGSSGKWPWISPASGTGSAWDTAVFHRGELLCHSLVCSRGSDSVISAWHHSPHFWQGHGAASEPWNLRASELLSWEPPRVRKLGRARTRCAVRVVLLHGFLGSPRAVRKFQLVRIFQARNHVPQSLVTARAAYPLSKDFRNYC